MSTPPGMSGAPLRIRSAGQATKLGGQDALELGRYLGCLFMDCLHQDQVGNPRKEKPPDRNGGGH
jgi:hypothetical protein